MKSKWTAISASAVLLSGLLVGCGGNEMNDQPEDVTYEPTRYDNNNMNYDDGGRGMDNDRDPRDRNRDIRQPGEPDTPYNMDEEEPDLDEEPSEERRGQ
ncbi:hypothetical protein H0266_15325 [Halobacillus locisalis]|uniref:Lipoprotein n=1 Tax=Halobacillus locisalis TaxID=220753 RepID=A0A838CWF9_9BACI|nr:hypothetical protein [Halobacillus locisalis]MBA2176268.1 hypothetical protein [Halobacillus locisalis]